jgi:CheY-like chemotaxis protein
MAKILIIDDEKPIRNLLRKILEGEGYEVLEAGNGRKGLDLYRQIGADLVLMDILMPVKDGMETTLQLVREFPGVKIIAMTGGRGDTNFLDVTKVLGARRTINKPFEVGALLQAVQEELAT